jgi:hypothetical protein
VRSPGELAIHPKCSMDRIVMNSVAQSCDLLPNLVKQRPLLRPLSEAHARAAPILLNELYAGLQCGRGPESRTRLPF